jgi:T4 RnlA family RNA ligase
MEFILPTKEQCDEICDNTDAFYKAERVVEGQNVVIYDYRLASISDFVNNNAFELRGLCYIEQDNGTWKRNLLLNKFFNHGQTEGWQADDLKDKKIVRVQNKEDGSILSFVKFSNGKVRAKSKMSFESDQAKMAQELIDKKVYNERTEKLSDNNYLQFINDCFTANLTPVMELVSPENQIVLEYQNTELILLQIRRNDGSYLDSTEMDRLASHYSIKITKDYDLNQLENVSSSYSEEEAREKIGDRKFQGFQEMVDFLENKEG